MTNSRQDNIMAKKFTLTGYHDDLLEKIVEQRYASRSEAVRASIQHHSQTIADDAETDIESLQLELEKISDQVEDILEKLDEKDSGVIRVTEQTPINASNNKQSTRAPAVKQNITEKLNNQGPLSMEEIADEIGEDILSVIKATDSLEEEGIIHTVGSNSEQYDLNR